MKYDSQDTVGLQHSEGLETSPKNESRKSPVNLTEIQMLTCSN